MAAAPQLSSVTLAALSPTSFVVTANGDLGRHDALELRDQVFPLIAANDAEIVLDLSGAHNLDPAVVGVIDSAASLMQRSGAQLVIVARDPRVLWLLELTGVDQIAKVQRSLRAAPMAASPIAAVHEPALTEVEGPRG